MYSTEQLEALQTALARGEKRVTFEGKAVEYRTVDELKVAIREVERGLRQKRIATGKQAPVSRQIRVTTSMRTNSRKWC